MPEYGDDPFSREFSRRDLVKYGLAGSVALATAGYAGRFGSVASAALDAASGTIVTWSPDTRPDALKSEKWWDCSLHQGQSGREGEAAHGSVRTGHDQAAGRGQDRHRAGHASGRTPTFSIRTARTGSSAR